MTHGNEPCGLAAVHFLLQPEVQKKLQGRVILVLNNVEGAQRYFAATSDDDRRDARISDANMNRIPEMFDSAAAHGYELKRLAELLPVFVLADFGIDFHSFPLVGPPMVIDVKGGDKRTETFIQHLPVPVRITNMVPVQDGHPLGWYIGGKEKNIPVIEIECGAHEDEKSFEIAIQTVTSALISNGFLDLPATKRTMRQQVYRVLDAVWFPDASYSLSRAHTTLGPIQKGEVLATGDDSPIVAKEDCVALFGRNTLKMRDTTEAAHEMLWLARLEGEREFLSVNGAADEN